MDGHPGTGGAGSAGFGSEINRDPSPAELRQFACVWSPLFLGAAGALLQRRPGGHPAAIAVWSAAAGLLLIGALRPRRLRGLFVAAQRLAYPVGWCVSRALLLLIFVGVVTPVGLLMRLRGRDPLGRRLDRAAATYWTARRAAPDPAGVLARASAAQPGLVREVVRFLREESRWWIAPVVLVLLVLGALVMLGGSAAAPFIYTLF